MGDPKDSSYARMALRRWRRPARGFRLSPGRLSVRRLRAKLWTLLGHLGRYVRSVRLLTRGLVVTGGSSSPPAAAAGGRRSPASAGKGGRQAAPATGNGSGSGKAPQRPLCMRSNSFYARAVAECLEFIKGSNAAPPPASPLAHGTPRRGVRC